MRRTRLRWPPRPRGRGVRPSRWAARRDLGREQLVVVDVGNVDERAERATVFVVHRLVVEVGEVGLRPVALTAEAGRAARGRERCPRRARRRPRSSAPRRWAARSSAGAGPARSPRPSAPEAGSGRGVGTSNSLVRSVGSGNRAAGRTSGGGSRRGRGGSSRERPPLASTAACASSAPRMRTPSFVGASEGSSSKSSGTGPRLDLSPAPGSYRRRAQTWASSSNFGLRLNLEELGLLVLQEVVDLGDHVVGPLLELLLGPVEIVLAELAVLLESLELVAGLAADVADRDPSPPRPGCARPSPAPCDAPR